MLRDNIRILTISWPLLTLASCASGQKGTSTSEEGWVTNYGGKSDDSYYGGSSTSSFDNARRRAENDHRGRCRNRHIAKEIYRNPEAVERYCGPPSEDEAWGTACASKLKDIFVARLDYVYELADWELVFKTCAAYPERCEAPDDLETMVLQTHAKESRLMYEDEVSAIDADEEWDRTKWDRVAAGIGNSLADRARKELEDPRRECVMEGTSTGWVQTCRDKSNLVP